MLKAVGPAYMLFGRVLLQKPHNGSQNDPKIDDFLSYVCTYFCHFLCLLFSRPSRILFSLVLQSNNNKSKQGKATQEKTQDQTCPRQDQTDRSSCHHAKPKSTRKSFRLHGGAQIVPEKNRESFPLSKDVVWCCLRMLLLAEYWGVLQEQLQTTIQG